MWTRGGRINIFVVGARFSFVDAILFQGISLYIVHTSIYAR